jgi:hypothetical protein
MKIEFLTDCYGWDEGFQAEVESEDDINLYFHDVWDRWTYIEKSLEGLEFKIVDEPEPSIKCGGKDVTYNRLMERAKELRKNDSIQNS